MGGYVAELERLVPSCSADSEDSVAEPARAQRRAAAVRVASPGSPWRRARKLSEGVGGATSAKTFFSRRCASTSDLHFGQVARCASTRSRVS